MPQRLFALLAAASSLLFCATSDAKNPHSSVDNDLLGVLNEAAAIASKHRLNVDDTPEFVTVWHRQELRALGVKDLFEALSLVPGIQTSIMQNGIKKVVMRGYNNPDNITFDRFKLIIDGHIIETAIFQNTSYYLNYPIELIDRIEVILGPASALVTSGALTGVIRVSTRLRGGREGAIFARIGSYDEIMGGLCRSYSMEGGGTLGVEYYYRVHDRSLEAGDYILEKSTPSISESSEWLRDRSFALRYSKEKFRLSARTKREVHGNYFGWEEHLEMSDEPSMANSYLYLQGSYDSDIGAKERLHLQLDYSHYRFDSTAQNYIETPDTAIPYEFALYLSEETWQLDTRLTTERFENHSLKAGLCTSTTKQIGDRFGIHYPNGSILDTKLVDSGLKREVSSLYLNDIVTLNDTIDIHLGIRYDYMSDMKKGYFSANTSLLYRFREGVGIKIGYGHAFRTPSWVELYSYPNPGVRVGDAELEAEESDMIEASLIYRPTLSGRLLVNLYRSRIRNLLDIFENPRSDPDAPGYANLPSRFSHGFELEYRLKPMPGHTFGASYSYNSTNYTTEYGTNQSMPGVARKKGYLYYILDLDASSTVSAYLRHMGSRTVNRDTDREDVPSYTTLDLTYSYSGAEGARLFMGVKNLFDEYVADISYYGRHDGIVRPGRRWFVTFEYPL